MPWTYLEEEAIADIGIEVRADSLEQLYTDACMSIMTLMTDIDDLKPAVTKEVLFEGKGVEDILFQVLDELVYLKDADLFFAKSVQCKRAETTEAELIFTGDTFDRQKHKVGNDIKAITMHDFYVVKEGGKWRAHFIIDI